jgi:mannosyl-3-phosphoglycerate phosphatase
MREVRANRLVVFTDLDGTLLSHDDYDWSAARPALAALAERAVPLIFVSSKTRAEIEVWRARLGNRDPFVSENGGAIYAPRGYFLGALAGAAVVDRYDRVEFGMPVSELRAALAEMARETGLALRGFGSMTVTEIAERTGLPATDAALAARREYDEPFVAEPPLDEAGAAALAAAARRRNLRLTRGGRFHHLLGANDKGIAARVLAEAFASPGEAVVTLAVGDGANDLDLLRTVDRPIVVARPDGSHVPELRAGVAHARFTRGAGPEGFAEGVLAYLAATC